MADLLCDPLGSIVVGALAPVKTMRGAAPSR